MKIYQLPLERTGMSGNLHRNIISISAVDEVRNTPHHLDPFRSLTLYRFPIIRE